MRKIFFFFKKVINNVFFYGSLNGSLAIIMAIPKGHDEQKKIIFLNIFIVFGSAPDLVSKKKKKYPDQWYFYAKSKTLKNTQFSDTFLGSVSRLNKKFTQENNYLGLLYCVLNLRQGKLFAVDEKITKNKGYSSMISGNKRQ